MSDQFLGQVMLAGFNFAPVGWAQCAGQLIPISQNTALFSLLGTYYGGNGTSNFALPNLQGNCAVGQGQGPGLSPYDVGQTGGSQTVTLLTQQVPAHNHTANARALRADQTVPGGNVFAESGVVGNIYNNSSNPPLVQMNQNTLVPAVGSNQPHNNMMPYLVLNWVIALQGIYPARS